MRLHLEAGKFSYTDAALLAGRPPPGLLGAASGGVFFYIATFGNYDKTSLHWPARDSIHLTVSVCLCVVDRID